MDTHSMIKNAIDAIGQAGEQDYVIAPAGHAAELEAGAPALAKLLKDAEIAAVARQYETRDREAISAQSKFKRDAHRVNLATFLATVFGAGILVVNSPLGESHPPTRNVLSVVFGVATILAGAWAAMSLYRIQRGKLLESWMTRRAEAESRRLDFFAQVTKPRSTDDPPSDVATSLLQLEYFRRYQLDVQSSYYKSRGRQHGDEAEKTLNYGAYAVGLTSLATAGAGLAAGISANPGWGLLAAIGVIGAALSSWATGKEGLNQDRRNSERYARTWDLLERLKGRLDRVREAVAGGHTEALPAFVAAVHEQLSLEHRQWLQAADQIHAALGKLDETLSNLET